MKESTLKALMAVLGALLVAWLVVIAFGRSGTDEPGGGGELGAMLDSLEPDSLRSITFSGGTVAGGPVRLERSGRSWRVEGHPADSLQVSRLLEALGNAHTGAPVALNPSNHARMEVDDASARIVVLEGAEAVDTLLLGKTGTSYSSVYVRLPGHDEVYLVDAELRPHASRDANEWRSKRIAAVDTTAVATLRVSRGNDSHTLERADSSWSVGSGTAAPQAVRDILSEVRSLQAMDFPAPDSASVLAPGDPDRTVEVVDGSGTELLVIRLWEPRGTGESNLMGRAEGPDVDQPDVLFRLAAWRADRLAPTSDRIEGREGS